jgi:hypothetical protein
MYKDTPKGSSLARETLEASLRAIGLARESEQARLKAERAAERAKIASIRESLKALALEQSITDPNSSEQVE